MFLKYFQFFFFNVDFTASRNKSDPVSHYIPSVSHSLSCNAFKIQLKYITCPHKCDAFHWKDFCCKRHCMSCIVIFAVFIITMGILATIPNEVLNVWRFCTQSKKMFQEKSRSFPWSILFPAQNTLL